MTIYLIFSAIVATITGVAYSYFYTPPNGSEDKKSNGLKNFIHVYQFVLNSACSFVGWMAFYALFLRFKGFLNSKNGFELSDLILLLIGLLGITGHLGELLFKGPKTIESYLKRRESK